jgi:hypothetical protein
MRLESGMLLTAAKKSYRSSDRKRVLIPQSIDVFRSMINFHVRLKKLAASCEECARFCGSVGNMRAVLSGIDKSRAFA